MCEENRRRDAGATRPSIFILESGTYPGRIRFTSLHVESSRTTRHSRRNADCFGDQAVGTQPGLVIMHNGDDHYFIDLQTTRHTLQFIADLLGRTHDVARPFPAPAYNRISLECEVPQFRDGLFGGGHGKSLPLEANAPNMQLSAGE